MRRLYIIINITNMIWVINKDSERRVSYFPLVNFVEFVESQIWEQNVLKIKALQKSPEFVLKIG